MLLEWVYVLGSQTLFFSFGEWVYDPFLKTLSLDTNSYFGMVEYPYWVQTKHIVLNGTVFFYIGHRFPRITFNRLIKLMLEDANFVGNGLHYQVCNGFRYHMDKFCLCYLWQEAQSGPHG